MVDKGIKLTKVSSVNCSPSDIASGKHYRISLTKASLNVNICMMVNLSTGSYTEPITLHAHTIICTANSV